MFIKNRKHIIEFILANIFLLNISVAAISNYSLNVFIIKIVSSTVLLILILIDVKQNNFDKPGIIKNHNPKKIFIIIGLFTMYLGITLLYSNNPAYGAQKILNFISSTVPSVIAFFYLIVTTNKERFKIFMIAIIAITLLTVIYIFIDYPFDQSSIYSYKAGRWSHVIYGRLIGSFAVVFLLYLSSRRNHFQIILYSVLSVIAIYGLYLSSLRSVMLGLIIVFCGILIFNIYKLLIDQSTRDKHPVPKIQNQASSYKSLIGLLFTAALTLSLILLIPAPEIIETRFENLTQIEDMKFGGDAPISTRLEALKISKKIFLKNPLFGVGFGGFRSYNEFTEVVRYPHNIFVEIGVEGGVIGLLVLCALCFVILKSSYRFSPLFFVFLLFTLFLAMFSKELSNQSLLWIFLAFTGINYNSKKI